MFNSIAFAHFIQYQTTNRELNLVDTHAHLYLSKFDEDRKEVMQRAAENGVNRIYLPNIDRHSIDSMLTMEKTYPERCFAMMGLHPCSVKDDYKEELQIVENWLKKRAFIAVGEIGLDLYWDKTFFAQQKEAFKMQMNWAKDLDIPIVIHSRESTNEVIEILKEEKTDKLRGIFHCFGGSVAEAKEIIDLGFLLGIGGVLTYKKSGLDQTLTEIDLENIVLETDAPFLSPVPFRGKRNESAYILNIAERLATIKNISVEEVAEVTTKNANSVFAYQFEKGNKTEVH